MIYPFIRESEILLDGTGSMDEILGKFVYTFNVGLTVLCRNGSKNVNILGCPEDQA